jgi:hypothetical protein
MMPKWKSWLSRKVPVYRSTKNGLSLIFPPADLPGASPQAHELLAEASAAFLFRDFERSAARFKDGLVIVRQLDHKRAELRILYDLGVVYDAMEESDLAIAKFGQASKLAHEIRDEFAIESRLLARDAERVAKTSGPSKIIGVPEYEWELEMMCLRALVAVMKGAGRSREAEGFIVKLQGLLRESRHV